MIKRGLAVFLAVLFVITSGCVGANSLLSVQEMLSLGEKHLLAFDYERALVQFLAVIEAEPMNPRGYTGAAVAYEGLGNESSAADILARGLEATGDAGIQGMLDMMRPPPDDPPDGMDADADMVVPPQPEPDPFWMDYELDQEDIEIALMYLHLWMSLPYSQSVQELEGNENKQLSFFEFTCFYYPYRWRKETNLLSSHDLDPVETDFFSVELMKKYSTQLLGVDVTQFDISQLFSSDYDDYEWVYLSDEHPGYYYHGGGYGDPGQAIFDEQVIERENDLIFFSYRLGWADGFEEPTDYGDYAATFRIMQEEDGEIFLRLVDCIPHS